ncbi:arylamine N-acetyltransferase [Dactylosporangium sp. CA-092794]|uniref:arylamine N-acetyltransferase n=1 Tax=Dactylosporangium sp. CA-092794 TaxID=3239929 RepID=UPI003D91A53F
MSLFDADEADLSRIAARLALPARLPAGLDGLGLLYRAWCRTVPFDNVRKRLFFAAGGRGEVPGSDAGRFLRDFLAGGTGGTCWASTYGLVALARWYGFAARLVTGVMLTDPGVRPNHASTAVTLDGEVYLVDSSMLFETPLRLADAPVRHDDPLHPVRARRSGADTWVVEWLPGHHRGDFVGCEISLAEVAPERVRAWHERTRGYSLFNDQLFVRRNRDGGIDSYGRGKLVSVDATGAVRTTPVPARERDALLAARFGLAPAVLAALPADRAAGPAFL